METVHRQVFRHGSALVLLSTKMVLSKRGWRSRRRIDSRDILVSSLGHSVACIYSGARLHGMDLLPSRVREVIASPVLPFAKKRNPNAVASAKNQDEVHEIQWDESGHARSP